MNILRLFRIILSIPKTLYFNFRCFPIKLAIKLPVFVSSNVRLGSLKGNITVKNNKRFCVKIGLSGSRGISPNPKGYFHCAKNGGIVFDGNVSIGLANSIRVENGTLFFGDGFSSNSNCFFSCSEGISFGKNCLLGYNVNIRDADGHRIIINEKVSALKKKIVIEDHVWLCSYVDVLKGSYIRENSVVGYKALVSSEFEKGNVIIAGIPAKIIKTDINWQK